MKFELKFSRFIHENVFESVVWQEVVILSRPKCVSVDEQQQLMDTRANRRSGTSRGVILGMGSTNERRCLYVAPSLIGLTHT